MDKDYLQSAVVSLNSNTTVEVDYYSGDGYIWTNIHLEYGGVNSVGTRLSFYGTSLADFMSAFEDLQKHQQEVELVQRLKDKNLIAK